MSVGQRSSVSLFLFDLYGKWYIAVLRKLLLQCKIIRNSSLSEILSRSRKLLSFLITVFTQTLKYMLLTLLPTRRKQSTALKITPAIIYTGKAWSFPSKHRVRFTTARLYNAVALIKGNHSLLTTPLEYASLFSSIRIDAIQFNVFSKSFGRKRRRSGV